MTAIFASTPLFVFVLCCGLVRNSPQLPPFSASYKVIIVLRRSKTFPAQLDVTISLEFWYKLVIVGFQVAKPCDLSER